MSRFVSAGTEDEGGDPPPSTSATFPSQNDRDAAWLSAQSAIDATRLQQKSSSSAQPEKSLYETLQANKAAKQEAFESAAKLTNQFQSLDEDEIEFLDSVVAVERAKEAAVKRETSEQLEAFRRLQGEAPAPSLEALEAQEGGVEWKATGARKRKKGPGGVVGGVKVRRTSSTVEREKKKEDGVASAATTMTTGREARPADHPPSSPVQQIASTSPPPLKPASSSPQTGGGDEVAKAKSPSPPPAGLGLAAYSSDEDD